MAYPKRSQTSTPDSDLKEDGVPCRKPGTSAIGGKGVAPASPMLGNASNPNKADIPERKKSSTVPSVSVVGLYSLPRIVALKRHNISLLCSYARKALPPSPCVQCHPVGITSSAADVSYCTLFHWMRSSMSRAVSSYSKNVCEMERLHSLTRNK